MIVTGGDTNVTTYFAMRLAADGTAATGLTATNFDLTYVRSGVASAAKADATAGTAGGAAVHVDNTVVEPDATNQPGLYRIDWPDAAFAASVREVLLTVKVATAFTEHLRVEIDPLGAAANTIADDIIALKAETVLIVEDTGTTIPATITTAQNDLNTITGADGVILLSGTQTSIDNIETDTGTTIPNILRLATGTADSGSTTTMVDAARTEADTDYWKDAWIRFTSGTIVGETRLITGFNFTTDTITFTPATTQAVGTNTYDLLPSANVVAQSLTGHTVQTGDSFAEIGTAGAGLLDLGGMSTAMKGEVQAEADASLVTINLDHLLAGATSSMPAQGAPSTTPTLEAAVMWLYKLAVNKTTQTATEFKLYNTGGGTVDTKATCSDDTTTGTKGQLATGP